MKKQSFTFSAALLFAANIFAGVTPGLKQQQSAGICFTENKGQVQDQDQKPRPDVLYGAMTGNMAVHIKNNGVSYQLYRVDRYKESENPKTKEKRQETDQQTIYRIDLNWLNRNAQFTQTEDEPLPGYSNYYTESCPNGALYVKSYTGITLNNLYRGINLHYYQKNGSLKHDYIVAPHADYKQIQLQVEGADISVNSDGSLILATPLGKVQEGAPVVYQGGRQLKARWQVKNNILSFEIEHYNPGIELLIDPVTRLWGTYYGGAGDEESNSCTTDALGNVYMAGYTTSNTSTRIATAGSHQLTYGGSSSAGGGDAFLVKFNSSGARQWATYYGGAANDYGSSCATDASGNVYLAGSSGSTVTGVIATAGSYQSASGGGGGDAMLVKFNGSGVRLWATYYGGTADEGASSCATDAAGNVYMVGTSNSLNAIATAGSHQSVFGGGSTGGGDAFLVKFDSNGSRQWATYYGGTGEDYGNSCATDASGNVFIAGYTGSGNGTSIATAGGHQPVYGTGSDAFLAKFDASGTRQWGTYYGGNYSELCYSCATDAVGNVYLAGLTSSNQSTTTAIATAGSHQSSFGGSVFVYDGFLVKFDASGARQWGTYYGGQSYDKIFSCATDANNNVYIAGQSNSVNSGAIVTLGSYQSTAGGAYDPFLAKFSPAGVRQWGTYYGGSADDNAYACTVDASGNVFMTGSTATNTGSVFASPGGHQQAHGGAYFDAYIVKFDVCNVAPVEPSPIDGPVSACAGVAASYSTTAAFGASSYTWSLPGGWSGAGNSNFIYATPGSSGVFTVTAGNACGVSPQQTLDVTVNETPTITVSTNINLLCAGESAILTAGGGATYTFNPGGAGTTSTVSPTVTSTYTVTGTDDNGCSNTATIIQGVDACTGLNPASHDQANGIFKLYPNPAQGIINLESDSDHEIVILNAIGQIVYTFQLSSGSHQVNIEHLAKGIYAVKITGAANSKNLKMIKE